MDFITSAPLVAAALEGPNAIAIVRAMNGATRPHEAAPGSIRGDFAVETAQNLVHASDTTENAAAELALWFKPEELLGYEREIDRWVLAPGSRVGARLAAPRRSAYHMTANAFAFWPGDHGGSRLVDHPQRSSLIRAAPIGWPASTPATPLSRSRVPTRSVPPRSPRRRCRARPRT